MSALRRRFAQVVATVPGLEATSLWQFLIEHQDMLDRLRAAGLFIYDGGWGFEGLPSAELSAFNSTRNPDVAAATSIIDRHVRMGFLSSHPMGSRPWFLGEASKSLAQAMAGQGAPIAGLPVVGWCGWYEGGADFFGTDGTHIRSGNWDVARAYVEAWIESVGSEGAYHG